MRIMIPLDGSALAEQALASASMLALQMHPLADLLLVRVVGYPTIDAGVLGPYPGVSGAGVIKDVLAAAQAYLDAKKQLPGFGGLRVQTRAEMGGAVQTICTLAQREHADLILMTSHGRSGLARAVLGSIADGVARAAPVPTLILPTGSAMSLPRPAWNILVPLDGSPLAEDILPAAATMARAVQGTLHLLMVLLPLAGQTDSDRISLREAETYLDALQSRLVRLGLVATTTVAWGDPASQILKTATAADHPADLIALATHARRGVVQVFVGSVAEQVIQHTPCPLLVVHPREEASITDAELLPATASL